MSWIQKYINQHIPIAPLISFRVLFGFMMLLSIIRFSTKGWIKELYVNPQVYFPFYGFGWVKPLGEQGMYLVFVLMGLSALGIMLGLFYRMAAPLFFLLFTYVELIDKTNYLNHYYFVSLVSLLLVLVPAHRAFSLDVLRRPQLAVTHVPAWTINIFKIQLGIVYFYAGLAKLNSEWLFDAMPLKMWLPAESHLPLIGWLFEYEWVAYLFSWFGAIYDLTIAFLLLIPSTRIVAYLAVIAFHVLTAILFPIGMFPYIMILSTLIFFSAAFHQRIWDGARSVLGYTYSIQQVVYYQFSKGFQPLMYTFLGLYLSFQLLFPFRYLLYGQGLFWHEQGYRFSWRVMLMEKAGYTVFKVTDSASGKMELVNNYDYLTPVQEKMMSTQPDMILQFAHFLEGVYKEKGFKEPEITVESYVTLNGRPSQTFIDPEVDLTKVKEGVGRKEWVLPMQEK